jgi:hypothetical protein
MSQTEDSPERRPRIRPRSRETKKTGLAKLRSCRCFDEVDRRLRLGWGSLELAKFIRDENGECTDISEAYVRKLVDQHRQAIPPAELSLTSTNTKVIRNASKKMSNGLNELAELEKLYDIQKSRIEIDFTNEQTIKKLFAGTGREIFYAMKILKQSADLKATLGLTKKHLGTVEVTGHRAAEIGDRYGNEAIGSVVADPDSRRKLLSLTDRLLAMGGDDLDAVFVGVSRAVPPRDPDIPDNVIDVEPGPDGE